MARCSRSASSHALKRRPACGTAHPNRLEVRDSRRPWLPAEVKPVLPDGRPSVRGARMPVEDRLYIGGDWVAPAGTGVIEVISPSTEEMVGAGARGHHRGHRQGGRRGPRRVRRQASGRAWPPRSGPQMLSSISPIIQGRADEIARLITDENGSPYSWWIMGQVFASTMVADFYAGLAKEFTVHRGAGRHDGQQGPRAQAPRRRRRRHRAVERAALHHDAEARPRRWSPAPPMVLKPAPETPLDAQVLAEIAHEAGPARRRAQHRARRPRGRRAPRHPPGRRQGRVHRQHRRRPQDRRAVRRAAPAGHPRARRQVGRDHPGRRRPRRRSCPPWCPPAP